MFTWFDVTEERLSAQGEIPTPMDVLSWDYYRYVCTHPIEKWNAPTSILYGSRDSLQSREIVQSFAHRFDCQLTISPDSDHPFETEKEREVVRQWLLKHI